MTDTTSIHVKIAQKAVAEYLEHHSAKNLENSNVPDDLREIGACFVTLKTKDGKLRGCIGTIKPKYKNLFIEIIRNAISAAFFDSRFKSLSQKEFSDIQFSVEVLSKPEEIFDMNQLDPKIYGLIIQDSMYFRGVLLPGIKGVDSVEEQIRIVKRKAGIDRYKKEGLRYFRFTTKKHY